MQEKKEEDLQQALNKVFEVGIDEVGRGAIFGPVFAAAVVLTEKNKFILKQFGVTDSKKLTPKKRKFLLSNIISGDSKFISIASASIVAKVSRDNLMERLEKKYSGYLIFKNKGYGTREHLSLIKKNGITKLHRKSFLKKSNLI